MAEPANIDPRHGRAGRQPDAAFLATLKANADPGLFGRMFARIQPHIATDAQLQALADAMKDVDFDSPAGDNPNIPSGFTYLGQFVDHDITLDLTSIAEKTEDPHATENFRTPRLDLDSVYGRGPDGSPHLYARGADNQPSPKLLLGKNVELGDPPGKFRNDLPRSPEGQALIGDHRNDENLLVAQTHVAFLKFHNKVVDLVKKPGLSDAAVFAEARQTVIWHYQWLVLHDFVERLTETGIVQRILNEGRKFYRFLRVPYMPVEFSAAAYRLGHSMVRQAYSHNRIFTEGGLAPATLDLEFKFTGLSGQIIGDLAPQPPTGPLPQATVPSNWIIDWSRFYDLEPFPHSANFKFNHARRIDPFIVPELHKLPGGGGNLAFRNLKRGLMLKLPSGQDVAAFMKLPVLTPADIATGLDGQAARAQGFDKSTPLWYYILKEAQVKSGGERLGPVGARIVAEVFIGLVAGDTTSYLSASPAWKPTLPARTPGTFTMADLLRFVDDINPVK